MEVVGLGRFKIKINFTTKNLQINNQCNWYHINNNIHYITQCSKIQIYNHLAKCLWKIVSFPKIIE